MKHLFSILLMLLPLAAFAAGVNTFTVYPTNYAVSGDTITHNGTVRTFAATTTASTIATNRVSLAGLMTNVFNAFGQYGAGISLTWGSATSLVFRGYNLTLATASGATNWAVVVTNLAPSTNFYAFSGPHYAMPGTNTANVKTNQANDMMAYLMDFATTNWFKTNSVATTNLLSVGVPPGGGTQTVYAPKLFHSISGTNGNFIYGGIYSGSTNTNVTVRSIHLKPFDTGETNYGALFFYNSATQIVAAIRANTNGYPMLYDAEDAQPWGLTDAFSVAVTTENEAALLNVGSAVTYFPILNPTAFTGRTTNLWTTTNYWSNSQQIFAGGLQAPGGVNATGGTITNAMFQSSTHTNALIKGVTTVSGSVAYTPGVNNNLVNGANASVVLGTNKILHLIGPTAAYSIAGFETNGILSGQEYTLVLTNPAVATITISHQSGTEPTTGKRIHTGAGDLTSTNNPAILELFNDRSLPGWRVKYLR